MIKLFAQTTNQNIYYTYIVDLCVYTYVYLYIYIYIYIYICILYKYNLLICFYITFVYFHENVEWVASADNLVFFIFSEKCFVFVFKLSEHLLLTPDRWHL